ncbi:PREDICTED: metacaspase-1-like [Ipomoea nil]|uniref:metacaspase-1-like n=1 Tax=Ipomoea nil TaxID=35883 RepID=UPI000901AA1D|nr:PREDICTED: metacaspase-1-like [Ipomoea nil]
MATKLEVCRRCGFRMVMHFSALTFRCPACQAVTHLRPPEPRRWPPEQPPPLSVHGRRRAVLCGVSYRNHKKSLAGSVNDVVAMRNLLVKRLGFPYASVVVLTEDERDPRRVPTKRNIRDAMRWLVYGCQPGDSVVFYYSGHGSQIRELTINEVDGHDEALCPLDFETEGKILDDEINETIVRPLPPGAVLHAIIDTCFSGTFLDLSHVCRMNREGYYSWEDHRIPYGPYKGTQGGLALSISACDDHQNSLGTSALTGISTGALTYSFVQIMMREPRLTYGQLLIALRNRVLEVQKAGLSSGNAPKSFSQEPQLSSSEPFKVHSKPVVI